MDADFGIDTLLSNLDIDLSDFKDAQGNSASENVIAVMSLIGFVGDTKDPQAQNKLEQKLISLDKSERSSLLSIYRESLDRLRLRAESLIQDAIFCQRKAGEFDGNGKKEDEAAVERLKNSLKENVEQIRKIDFDQLDKRVTRLENALALDHKLAFEQDVMKASGDIQDLKKNIEPLLATLKEIRPYLDKMAASVKVKRGITFRPAGGSFDKATSGGKPASPAPKNEDGTPPKKKVIIRRKP